MKKTGNTNKTFQQQLLWYSVSLIAAMVVLVSVIFFISSRETFKLQTQTSRYLYVRQLTTYLNGYRENLDSFFQSGSEQYLQNMNLYLARSTDMLHSIEESGSVGNTDILFLLHGIENGLDFIRRRSEPFAAEEISDSTYAEYATLSRVVSYLLDYTDNKLLSAVIADDAVRIAESRQFIGRFRSVLLIVVIGITAGYVAAALLLTSSLVSPIRKMVHAARQITNGNLAIPDISVQGASELAFLGDTLNRMKASLLERLSALQENADLEKKLHEQELQQVKILKELEAAQFLSLQAQIQPHFLFNTLNVIAQTALFEQAAQTRTLLFDLSSMLRYTLEARTAVSVEAEFDFIRRYLHIQQTRFGDRLSFELSCGAEAYRVMIPPLLIQPFVENAVIHGLEPLEDGGTLSLAIALEGDALSITVCDNGTGMTDEKMAALLDDSLPDDRPQTSHIGVKNVVTRLRLYYGSSARISIRRIAPHGTQVELLVPQSGGTRV